MGRGGRPWSRLRAEVAGEETHCWLCGEWIDYSLPAFHDRSYELDHVVPKSKGGEDVRANVRASHRECNQDRGNSTAEPAQPRFSRSW